LGNIKIGFSVENSIKSSIIDSWIMLFERILAVDVIIINKYIVYSYYEYMLYIYQRVAHK